MTAPFRCETGGMIDRSRELKFRFNGRSYAGHPGDTLASALLANGVRLIGRSFKYHRPRGLVSAGVDEPNGLVGLGEGEDHEPNARATQVELYDGLIARAQNAWPSLERDWGALADLLSPLIPAGFYYKTFIGGPKGAWTKFYEPLIRRAAGLGVAPRNADPSRYDKRYAHCDILIVGAGVAGLSAALTASETGARVILVDEQPVAGGMLLASDELVESRVGAEWVRDTLRALEAHPDFTLLQRATVFGRYDDGLAMGVQRIGDGSDPAALRQRLWQIRARRIILATGAHEQPLLFSNNDTPGVMLASAAQIYARRFGALVGRRIVVATESSSAYEAAKALTDAGAEIVAIVDGRDAQSNSPFAVFPRSAVERVSGGKAVRYASVLHENGRRSRLACDSVLMSSRWQPALHLHSHVGGKSRYDGHLRCFVPDPDTGAAVSVGACNGRFATSDCHADGLSAGMAAARECGFRPRQQNRIPKHDTAPPSPPVQPFRVFARAKSFVDFQNDVTAADVDLAAVEGFISVEHLKRYTTIGMATDQGKTSNLNALSRMGERLNLSPREVGTTTFRPPYTPVTLGAMAGVYVRDLMDAERVTPMHAWHKHHGACFENVGQWKRPWYYPKGQERMADAVQRECRAVRESVGLFDASTLGKIDVQGPDAATFLDRVYANRCETLKVGRCRYGLMLSDDGMLMDDGVIVRTASDRFLITTTTGNAALVMQHLEDLSQTEWPELRVYLTSVTEHWSASVVTGPHARRLLDKVVSGVDLSNEAFPHLSFAEAVIEGLPVRLHRISFTGELSYEVHASAEYGLRIWEILFEAGQELGVTPYGTEATHILRAEKGYVIIGQETDGTVTPFDLGLDWAIDKAKADFIGKRSLTRPALLDRNRKQLVGLVPTDGRTVPEEGSQLTLMARSRIPVPMLGHVTSAYWSSATGGPIALALLKGGRNRQGEAVFARSAGKAVQCRVCPPVFYDPKGGRMRA
jgi:sarcosine oxidase subunit alpha